MSVYIKVLKILLKTAHARAFYVDFFAFKYLILDGFSVGVVPDIRVILGG